MASFDERFDNWRRWCETRGVQYGRVGSLEGNYRSPQCWEPPNPRPPMIDVPDAILINRAYTWLSIHAPREAKTIKVMTFMHHWRERWKAQKLGIHYTKLDEAYKTARIMLKNVSEHIERKRIKLVISSIHLTTVQAVNPPGAEVGSSAEG